MQVTSYKAVPTANDLFKAKYTKYMRWSVVGALIFTILFFLFSPKYHPNPYKLRNRTLEAVDTVEAVDVPPPPQEVQKPVVNVEAVEDSEADEDVEIADTLLDAQDVLSDMFGSGTGSGDVFEATQSKPVLKQFVSPEYPEMARASQLEGTVVVKVQVGTDGSVLQAIVIQSVHPLLDREAVAAAKRCKFIPGKQRDIPVKAWMAIPFAFRLH